MGDAEVTQEIVNALCKLHSGREWVSFPELRLGTGYGGKWEQRIDVFAISCYPSSGLQSISYEVKASRSDFLRELQTPEKRRAAMELSNLFYFVAPVDVIQREELPPDCGLKIFQQGRLVTTCKATFRDRSSPEWRFVASVCRRVIGMADLPTFTTIPESELQGLGYDERMFLARTIADARSLEPVLRIKLDRTAEILERAAMFLRKDALYDHI